MNVLNLVTFIFALLFFFIASQAGYYFLGYYKVIQEAGTDQFIMIRRATDSAIRPALQTLYIAALVTGIILVVLGRKQAGSARGIMVSVSVLLLIADIVLAKSVSETINAAINTSSSDALNAMPDVQKRWLNMLLIRGALSISGFVIVIASLVFTEPGDA